MSVLVKVCGLGRDSEVQAAVDAGVDAVGFVFARSVREIAPKDAAAISARLPSHVRKVAVMQHPENERWQEVLRVLAPDVLQTDAEDYAALDVPDVIERWPVFREGGAEPAADGAYVFEGQKSGQGQTVDWSHAAAHATKGRMILAGGLAPHNVAEAVERVRPFGVDVSSGVESAPGRKDSGKIIEFVSAVRAAEKKL